MRYTDRSLAEQMRLHELEIAARKQLLDFTEADERRLASIAGLIESEINEIIELFYLQLLAVDEIALVIGDADSLARLKSYQRQYVLELFSGNYDASYVNNRLRIGLVHKRIGVETKHYIAAMAVLKKILAQWIRLGHEDPSQVDDILTALEKLLNFDIQLVFDTFINTLVSEIETSKNKLEVYAASLEEEVRKRTRELEELSQRDPMTGLLNRRALESFLEHELAVVNRNNFPLSALYLDMDGFKQLNDIKGHVAGDELLVLIGNILQQEARDSDLVCRMGGDEFCIVLLQSSEAQAAALAERVITEFVQQNTEDCSLSIGLAEYHADDGTDCDRFIHRADQAMYAAKKIAGNATVSYTSLAQPS